MSATNRGTIRNKGDVYLTPLKTVESILAELTMNNKQLIWAEPCRGAGSHADRIYRYLPENSLWAEIDLGKDFLKENLQADVHFTNPPFSIALEFLQKSLKEATSVIYLLRLNFLGSKKRKKFWQENPPTHIFVLSERPSFTGYGTDATEYAWFVWDRNFICKRQPGIYVI